LGFSVRICLCARSFSIIGYQKIGRSERAAKVEDIVSEEMKDQKKPDDSQNADGEEPQIFDVKKDINGHKLNRRHFITITAVTATTAALGLAISDQTDKHPDTEVINPGKREQLALEVEVTGMTVLPAATIFEKIWKITNKSAYGCHEAILRLFAKEKPANAQVFYIPLIPPGDKTEVAIRMAVPETAGKYLYNWQIEMGEQVALHEFPLIVTDFALAESPHPYDNNMNVEYPIDNPDSNAVFTRIHFSEIHVEDGNDFITVETPDGTIIDTYTGDLLDVWSSAIPGHSVIVRLLSDDSETFWGFAVDQLQSVEGIQIYLPMIFNEPACACDTVHYWYPN
jgi:hypothetical protein